MKEEIKTIWQVRNNRVVPLFRPQVRCPLNNLPICKVSTVRRNVNFLSLPTTVVKNQLSIVWCDQPIFWSSNHPNLVKYFKVQCCRRPIGIGTVRSGNETKNQQQKKIYYVRWFWYSPGPIRTPNLVTNSVVAGPIMSAVTDFNCRKR